MAELQRFADYGRGDVCAILAPGVDFRPQRGVWGVWGIVPVPPGNGDYVFFVTIGQKQAGHTFHEGVDEDGILSWQSQPSQDLSNPTIRGLIQHDDRRNSVYLFLRTKRNAPYTYFGRLRYVAHDPERERPVHFRWQLLDWGEEAVRAASRIGLPVGEGPVTTASGDEHTDVLECHRQPSKPKLRRRASTGMVHLNKDPR